MVALHSEGITLYIRKRGIIPVNSSDFLSTLHKEMKRSFMEEKDNPNSEWVKVETRPTVIDGQYAFETLYKKVYY